jgi:hypothetical protein
MRGQALPVALRAGVCVTALLAIAVAAVAQDAPYQCTQGFVKRLMATTDGHRMKMRGRFEIAPDFDPTVDGMRIDLVYEPETDPANGLYTALLPASGFVATRGGFLYRDRNGAVDGITRVRIRRQPFGVHGVTIARKDGAGLFGMHAGVLRVVLRSGNSCVRSCGGDCTMHGPRMVCHPGSDTALCGILSGCEMLNSASGQCMFPYPSSHFETADGMTDSGRRIAFPRRAMSINNAGVRVDPTEWNKLDGYSPGSMMLANFPQGVDLALSNVPPLTNFALSTGTASATVLIDADTLEHVEHFGENDVSIAVNNMPVAPPSQAFIIRPGRRLKNNGHYIVAIRHLFDGGGMPIAPDPAFQALRDGTPSGSAALEARRPQFEQIFTTLAAAGVSRSDLVLAWEFHTASDDSLERWLLSMRDETFAALGIGAPAFQVTTVENDPFGDPRVCRRVQGTYDVPRYMTDDNPGSRLVIGPAGVPVQQGVTKAPFTAIIPCSLLNPLPHPGRPIFYGHGLLGSGLGEVSSGHLRTLADTYGFVVVATDWQGMSSADMSTIISFIPDISGFPTLPERLHQGILNQLVLGHLLGAPNGLAADPAFLGTIDPSEVFYYGNSQGGILGGSVMALTQETTRGVLGVPAANFSTLLQRSIDFNPFFFVLRQSYSSDLDRILLYPLLQQLWDRSEPNGWYHHTLPGTLPNTPPHKILVHMATSDDEVANIATEIMVRTLGIPQVSPVVKSYYNIPEMAAPFDGSAMIESDAGYPTPPTTNIPPPDNPVHGLMRQRPAIQAQIDAFLRTGGNVQNFCSGPCDPE